MEIFQFDARIDELNVEKCYSITNRLLPQYIMVIMTFTEKLLFSGCHGYSSNIGEFYDWKNMNKAWEYNKPKIDFFSFVHGLKMKNGIILYYCWFVL